MMPNARALVVALGVLLSLLALSSATAEARAVVAYHGGTFLGPVIVEPGEQIDGDLVVVFGDATIEGRVTGDVTVIGGSAYLGPWAWIGGHVNALGGEVVGPDAVAARAEFPHQDSHLIWPIAWDIVALVVFLLFPLRTRMALDRLERHPGLCTLAGIAGWLAVIPLGVVLFCTFFLIPLIAVEAVALIAAMFLGQSAIALLLGRRLLELIAPATTPAPLAALLVGLVLVTAAELVPFAGPFVWGLVALVGVGAVLLAFVREESISGSAARRPPVSGPPMPIS